MVHFDLVLLQQLHQLAGRTTEQRLRCPRLCPTDADHRLLVGQHLRRPALQLCQLLHLRGKKEKPLKNGRLARFYCAKLTHVHLFYFKWDADHFLRIFCWPEIYLTKNTLNAHFRETAPFCTATTLQPRQQPLPQLQPPRPHLQPPVNQSVPDLFARKT